MSLNFNQVILSGNLVEDPKFPTETLGSFRMAVSTSFRSKNDPNVWVERTLFINVKSFSSAGVRVLKGLSKGDAVFVVGDLRNDDWKDSQGQDRRSYVVVANMVKRVESTGRGKRSFDNVVDDAENRTDLNTEQESSQEAEVPF